MSTFHTLLVSARPIHTAATKSCCMGLMVWQTAEMEQGRRKKKIFAGNQALCTLIMYFSLPIPLFVNTLGGSIDIQCYNNFTA